MPIFTIEATYRIPIYRQRRYESDALAEACRLAIEDDDWEGQKEDCETAGETYVTGIWARRCIALQRSGAPRPLPLRREPPAQGRALRSPARLA